MVTGFQRRVKSEHLFDLVAGDFTPFVAQTFAHLNPVTGGVYELNPILSGLVLPVAQYPDVGADAGVVKQLLRQGDDGFEPVVLQNPAADFALAAARIAGKQRRAIHHDGHTPATVLRVFHPGEHVLKK